MRTGRVTGVGQVRSPSISQLRASIDPEFNHKSSDNLASSLRSRPINPVRSSRKRASAQVELIKSLILIYLIGDLLDKKQPENCVKGAFYPWSWQIESLNILRCQSHAGH
jgi:hypothetical protein